LKKPEKSREEWKFSKALSSLSIGMWRRRKRLSRVEVKIPKHKTGSSRFSPTNVERTTGKLNRGGKEIKEWMKRLLVCPGLAPERRGKN